MDKALCPICLQPNPDSTESSGSLTQWVSGCRCSQIKEEEELFLSLRLCTRCHKRINLVRHGSFTQWIFRTDLCSCEQPKLEDLTIENSTSDEQNILDYPEMENISVDFPRERFKPIEELGRGAGSIVFRCQDRLLGKIVAVKILTNSDSDAIISFQEEARLISRLSHKNIIEIIDISSTEKGTPYLVLEYVLGVDLKTLLLEKGAFPWQAVLDLAIQICDAMACAHKEGIFHRDLKPANILIAGDESSSSKMLVKIIDFGIAATLESKLEYQGKTLAGTPAYMSPDQALGHSFDSRSEVYTLGVLLYESLTGNLPYQGETALEILQNKLERVPPPLIVSPELLDLPELPNNLKEVVYKALSQNRESRYADFSEMKAALESCIDDTSMQITEIEAPAPHIAVLSGQERPARGKLAVIAAVATVAIIALVSYPIYLLFKETPDYKPSYKDSEIKARLNNFEHREEVEQLTLGSFQKGAEEGELIGKGAITAKALDQLEGDTSTTKLQLNKVMLEGPAIERLSRLDLNLQSLDLSGNGIKDRDLEAMKRFKHLKSIKGLDVSNTEITGENLDMFANLEELYITGPHITASGLDKISKLKNIKVISLSGNRNISTRDIEKLAGNLKLKELLIKDNGLSAQELAPFASIPSLEKLSFNDRKISAADIRVIRDSHIKEMEIWRGSGVSQKALETMPTLTGLKSLTIFQPVIDKNQIKQLKGAMPAKIKLEFPERKKR
ncbi:MAG: protein kinase [Cyanobacteriota/Melainabacteria group bacterium]